MLVEGSGKSVVIRMGGVALTMGMLVDGRTGVGVAIHCPSHGCSVVEY
jgi:hypothetical protein